MNKDLTEVINNTETIPELHERLLNSEPKLITNYVPGNGAEEKDAFLRGEVRNPNHSYPKLQNYDFDGALEKIEQVESQILNHPDLNQKHKQAYEQFSQGFKDKTKLMALVNQYKQADSQEEKDRIAAEFMKLNSELYGVPDEDTYRSLLSEKMAAIDKKNLTGEAGALAEELRRLLALPEDSEKATRFVPSQETVSWMQGVAESLYGTMLDRVPEGDTFNRYEIQAVFQDILDSDFGDSASGWKVDVEAAKSVNVKSSEKRVVLPEDLGDLSRAKVQALIVHELGVHVLRAITGSETDLEPLSTGLNEYYDAEEGLGVIMEQALLGKYQERGIPHYLTVGLVYFDKKDFRDTYEVKWRLSALEKIKQNEDLTEDVINQAKSAAYGQTLRIMRGTDELPWFKDLAYYNGSADMWQHLESIKGDDLKFMFVLLGKANPANKEHERLMYETRT